MNASLVQGIKHTPFEVVFGQKFRANLALWQLIGEPGVDVEDNLPSSIREQLEETCNKAVATDESKINTDERE